MTPPQNHDEHDDAVHDHDHDHNHDRGHHSHHHAPASFGAAFAIGAALNAGFVGAEFIYGLSANSVALLADAAHNLSDVLALLLSWGAATLGRRLPSARRTYGWGSGTILAALINAAILLIGVGGIGVEAIRRFADPAPIASATVVWVAAAGIAVNGVTAWMFSRGHDDLNIRAAFLHMAADALISAGVVVAALVIGETGWLWLDPMTSLVIAGVIAAGTWGVLVDAVNLSVGGVPSRIAPSDVRACLRELPGVSEVHDLHVWGLSTTETALTAHLVRVDGDDAALIQAACTALRGRFGIGHVTLQLETSDLAALCVLRPDHVV